MDKDTCRQVAQMIAGIVVVDDVLEPAEEAFLDRMLQRFDIPEQERDVIFPILDGDEAAERFRRMSAEVQQEAMDLLIQAAAADGQIVLEERRYLASVAKVVGVSDDELERRLDAAL